MGYLIQNDYKSLIQIDNLNQIIGNDTSLLQRMEEMAIDELKSYLTQKYKIADEFTETTKYQYGIASKANDRVYIDALAHNQSNNYTVNSLVLVNGMIYIAIVPVSAGTFDPLQWRLLGAQYAKFFVKQPSTSWSYYSQYSTSNVVFYKNKEYTATRSNTGLSPDNYPEVWGTGIEYTIAGSYYPNDTSKWIAGDNRNQQVLTRLIDIVLYHIHSRIAPHNIPDLRVKRYDDTISWLKNCARGNDFNAGIELIEPKQGFRNRYGFSLPKQNYNF